VRVPETRSVIYCVVPRRLARKVHEPLREFFHDDTGVEVIVEQRRGERRSGRDRRSPDATVVTLRDRREIRARAGRRIEQRRASLVPVEPPELPESVLPYRDQLRFVERLEPLTVQQEDADTARLIGRFQGGERDVFSRVYLRYFDRVYSYLRIMLADPHEAEDTTQDVFIRVMEALPSYERREVPFRAWLFRIVRNSGISRLRQAQRLTLEPPEQIARREEPESQLPPPDSLEWLQDHELLSWVERLPLAQRQVIVLRYMLELNGLELAAVLGRSPDAVRQLHHRAMRTLRERMAERKKERGNKSENSYSGRRRARPKAMTRRPRPSPVLQARRYLSA
jgi:RNA polymerase sigma-70 factor (ECF subfamily)